MNNKHGYTVHRVHSTHVMVPLHILIIYCHSEVTLRLLFTIGSPSIHICRMSMAIWITSNSSNDFLFLSFFLLLHLHRFIFVFLPLCVEFLSNNTKFTLNLTSAQRMKMRFMCLLSVNQPAIRVHIFLTTIETKTKLI